MQFTAITHTPRTWAVLRVLCEKPLANCRFNPSKTSSSDGEAHSSLAGRAHVWDS